MAIPFARSCPEHVFAQAVQDASDPERRLDDGRNVLPGRLRSSLLLELDNLLVQLDLFDSLTDWDLEGYFASNFEFHMHL